jgi:hypothetical protein
VRPARIEEVVIVARGSDGREYFDFPEREPASTSPEAPPAKRSRLRGRGSVVLLGFLAVGLAGWAWDATQHDHDGGHGAPATEAELEREMTVGTFMADDGRSVTVSSANCFGEGDPTTAGGYTHFDCSLVFDDGSGDEVIVHLTESNELFFVSSEGGS